MVSIHVLHEDEGTDGGESGSHLEELAHSTQTRVWTPNLFS
jgi:hypothetical protein